MKNQKGITLISLVITIIILVILAGVSIAIVFDEDGIITKSKKAAENMEIAALEEQEMLNTLYYKLNIGSTSGGNTSNSGEFEVKYNNLKVEYEDYKAKVTEALTNIGVEASEEDDAQTIATNINNIQGSSNIYYLGTGTSFDIKSKLPNDYANLTVNNFICVTGNATASCGKNPGPLTINSISASGTLNGISTNYNSSTGIFTCSRTISVKYNSDHYNNTNISGSKDVPLSVYLVIGDIVQI